jgi:hypothetical protein
VVPYVFISLFDLITDGIVVSHHTQRKEEKLIILVVHSVISIELLDFCGLFAGLSFISLY